MQASRFEAHQIPVAASDRRAIGPSGIKQPKINRRDNGLRNSLLLSILCLFFRSLIGQECLANDAIEGLLAATFRLTDGEHSGTGFLVTDPSVTNPESKTNEVILVTAKHVFEQMNGTKCDLILRTKIGEDEFVRLSVTIDIRDGDQRLWLQHPDVDVATLKIDLPKNASAKPIPFERLADESKLKDRTVRVGQETWIACFPAKLEANEAGWPVLRKGTIASYPLKPARTTKTFLVDYNVFGGDSGAPVAVIVDEKILLVGVASSMHRQTDRTTLPFEERVVHFPLGISIVVHAEFLRETICFKKEE